MLVVIAIIAGMLLPALARAKSKAKGVACMNKMKQIGLAHTFYKDANEGEFVQLAKLEYVSPDAIVPGNQKWWPDLRSITDQSPEGLLASIIDPSRRVDSKYLAYTALFNDGRAIVGIITSGSGKSLKMNIPGVGAQTVNRSD